MAHSHPDGNRSCSSLVPPVSLLRTLNIIVKYRWRHAVNAPKKSTLHSEFDVLGTIKSNQVLGIRNLCNLQAYFNFHFKAVFIGESEHIVPDVSQRSGSHNSLYRFTIAAAWYDTVRIKIGIVFCGIDFDHSFTIVNPRWSYFFELGRIVCFCYVFKGLLGLFVNIEAWITLESSLE